MSVVASSSRKILVRLLSADAGLESAPAAPGAAPDWVAAAPRPVRGEHPWDEAHRVVRDPAAAGLESLAAPAYAEPDLVQAFPYERSADVGLESLAAAHPCAEVGHDDFWPVGAPEFGWHLDDDHSGLKSAREHAGPGGRRVRVGILDTGYDPAHVTRPEHLREDLQRNFVDVDSADATDPGRHFPGNQPGHGTATMALLAGRRVRIERGDFDDFLGGAPHAEVVPIRIADSVIHFSSSGMARGIDYAVAAGCEVVSISMGGVPARSWAAAVNRAYEAGVAIFAAAGNRFGPSPPSSIIYPARFNRVVAVCGVTANKSPYYRSGLHSHMQGCFGPASKMGTALAAYTPNAPWAVMGCEGLVGFGGGTSSATPQAAATAALWLQAVGAPAGADPWQRVEAVRHALFGTADRDVPDRERYFGQGLLRARAALDVPFRDDLPMTPPDEVSFAWFRLLGVLESVPAPTTQEQMFEVEALQVYLQTPALQTIAGGADPSADELPAAEVKRLAGAMRALPTVSAALRAHLNDVYRRL